MTPSGSEGDKGLGFGGPGVVSGITCSVTVAAGMVGLAVAVAVQVWVWLGVGVLVLVWVAVGVLVLV
ncbi:MAG: hypothetical protein CEE40_07800 [Chloroflexi bacterium B3_Chlor]|nr:MAG: hypothetical protein CEE40_07800 [Chloroflexi bacterium B3_Chlor]